jgi:hypothetical protein
VMTAVTRSIGVRSKAGFRTGIPSGTVGVPQRHATSARPRSSISTSAPERTGSSVEEGAAT